MVQKQSPPLFFLILTAGWFYFALLFAQQPNKQYEEYIERYKTIAMSNQKNHKIPASITMAQAILESGAGKGRLATQANNHFGIKCGSGWTGRTISHDDDARNECFRVYANADESFSDHALFLSTRSRYASLFQLSAKDYKGWAHGLSRAGYATAKDYPQKLIRLIELYNLHQLDLDADRYDKRKDPSTNRNQPTHTSTPTTIAIHERIKINGLTCVITTPEDTYLSIANEFNVSAQRIIYYNDLPNINYPIVGNIVYLKKKKSKAQKGVLNHTVLPGENLHYISQMYGIRLQSIYKYNDIPADYQIKAGDQIKLR